MIILLAIAIVAVLALAACIGSAYYFAVDPEIQGLFRKMNDKKNAI